MKVLRIIRSPEDIVIPKGMTRKIKYGVAHCTAGPQNQSTQTIFNHWKNFNGWKNVGYHFMINPDGTVEQLAELDQVTNGVKGYNSNSIHFTYKGGIDANGKPVDNRTEAQKKAQIMIMTRLKELFPDIIYKGHREFSTDQNGNGIIERWEWIKSCPAFDLPTWIVAIGFDKKLEPAKIIYKLNYPLIKNETVLAIQHALAITPDYIFGAGTDQQVKNFQYKKGITVDGQVGEGTAAKLIGRIDPDKLYKSTKGDVARGQHYIDLLKQIKNRK